MLIDVFFVVDCVLCFNNQVMVTAAFYGLHDRRYGHIICPSFPETKEMKRK